MSNRYRDKEKILKLYYLGSSPTQLSKEYHVPQSTLFSWVKKYPKSVVTSSSHQQIKGWSRLMSHCKKLEAEVTFLKRTAIKKIPLRERLRMIDDEYGKESLHVQCEALDVSRGTYLNHKNRNKRDNTWFKKREAEYSAIIAKIFEESGHIYGAKKITAIMQHGGKPVTVKYVRRLMAESGLISIRSTSSKDRWMVSRNLTRAAHASSDFNVSGINQIWVSDTSAVRVHGRFYYVCVYIDLFSRKVVGWKIGNNNSTQLVKKTFMAAYESRGNPTSLTIHTDNGSCYVSYSYNELLRKLKLSHSYSRIGIPHDNAVAESFFNTMKRESVFFNGFPKSRIDLERRVSNFVLRYNSIRPHEHLDYNSPEVFEASYIK